MSESLNVVALISGGKDSVFSILHCLENGHKVVALANLYPKQSTLTEVGNSSDKEEDQEGEDLNSFMYQTVGHSIIPLYADCLDIPLYRREITGSAVQTSRYYDSSNLGSVVDETEDLIPLLKEVLQAHPEANALCSGAILSTYQRTRVESVAIRLGLTPLAYLWQYPALPPPSGRGESLVGLLEDMASAGCDARIIKIASGGIKESLLWSNVADPRMQARLVGGLLPFFPDHEFWLRGAVLGEGGEYETLAINGPRHLWKRRIEMSMDHMSAFTGEGGVSYLRLAKPQTVENEPDNSLSRDSLRVPGTFDSQFQTVLEIMRSRGPLNTENIDKLDSLGLKHPRQESSILLQPTQCICPDSVAIFNLTSQVVAPIRDSNTAGTQMQQIRDDLKSRLDSVSVSLGLSRPLPTSTIVFTMLLLKDISNFGVVNTIYGSLFQPGEPNPPARVTVATLLPEGVEVSLNVILDLGLRDARRGLHVQSRSYWAPANIGPYSQAICVPLKTKQDQAPNVHDAEIVELVHMAGQIPLMPHAMQLSKTDFPEQAVLSLQHLWRVGQERGVDIWPWAIAFLESSKDGSFRAELSSQVWRNAHLAGTRPKNRPDGEDNEEDEEGPDAWDLQYNRAAISQASATQPRPGEHLHLLPNSAVLRPDDEPSAFIPPFIAAEVISLPRDAPVEWWSLGITNLPTSPGSKPRASTVRKDYVWGSIVRVSVLPPAYATTECSVHLATVMISPERTPSNGFESIACIKDDLLALLFSDVDNLQTTAASANVVYGTAFVSTRGVEAWSRLRQDRLFKDVAVIPCNVVFGHFSSAHDARTEQQGLSASSEPPQGKLSVDRPDDEATVEMEGASCEPLAIAITIRIDEARINSGSSN
ncbi:hypothetical protein H2200_009333 [Cladophialophora chaetospira]|uniref:Diphthine--ammonia ligase n=1 Tax=Cladophialophora chaetospira TaxID=386627 RepID=A0AA38X3Y6_9EURO|nr:hypothetical protein H2200_009333 [Cladophialophora chaetospira]